MARDSTDDRSAASAYGPHLDRVQQRPGGRSAHTRARVLVAVRAELLESGYAALADPRILRLFHALAAAGAEADGDLLDTLRAFWSARFAGAQGMIARGAERGELPPAVDGYAVIEQLVAPLYFRALVSGERVDVAFVHGCVARCVSAVPKPVTSRALSALDDPAGRGRRHGDGRRGSTVVRRSVRIH